MKRVSSMAILSIAVSGLLLLSAMARAGDVPPFFIYQGRVAVQGTNFDGTGQFKLALVSADGSETYWSHDLTSVNGSEPSSAISIPVTRGLFYIAVGDTNVTGMAALPANLFRDAMPRLRVWFSDGATPFEHLTPDHELGSVPYALVAGQVATGSIGTNALGGEVLDRFVDRAGDSMTGPLQVPADGLSAGGSQLVLHNGNVGVGTATPGSPLTVVGAASSGAIIFEAYSGTNRVCWTRKK